MKLTKYIKKFEFFKFQVGSLTRIIIIFLVPTIFTLLMFNPFSRIELAPNTSELQYIPKSEIDKNLSNFFLSEFFQTSLKLGWYNICFENYGILSRGGNIVKPIFDNRGNVQIRYKQLLPEPFATDFKTLNATPFKEATCNLIGGDIMGIVTGSSTVTIGAFMNDMPGDNTSIGDNKFRFDLIIDMSKSSFYIKHDWRAYLAKYFVIFIFWSSLILLARSLKNFLIVKKHRKKYIT